MVSAYHCGSCTVVRKINEMVVVAVVGVVVVAVGAVVVVDVGEFRVDEVLSLRWGLSCVA